LPPKSEVVQQPSEKEEIHNDPPAPEKQEKDELHEFLAGLYLEQYLTLLRQSRVDFILLQELKDEDLKELGIAFGDRKRIFKALQKGTPS
jgi:hypothetical protein